MGNVFMIFKDFRVHDQTESWTFQTAKYMNVEDPYA